jgi:hypothetical protein
MENKDGNFTLLVVAGLVVMFVFLFTAVMTPVAKPFTLTPAASGSLPAAFVSPGTPALDPHMSVTLNTVNGSGVDVVAYGGSIRYNDSISVYIYQDGLLQGPYNTTAELVSSTSGIIARALVFVGPVSGNINILVRDLSRNTYNSANLST